MKKITLWIIIIIAGWIVPTKILWPVTCGIIGYFDKTQGEE